MRFFHAVALTSEVIAVLRIIFALLFIENSRKASEQFNIGLFLLVSIAGIVASVDMFIWAFQ